MRFDIYRTDPATLIEALASEGIVRQYLAAQEAELPSIADRGLAAYLRRLNTAAARTLGSGITVLAKQDAAIADALLSDLLAVATWHGWELPLERQGERELDPQGLQRGLLGSDPGVEGATVVVIDHAHVGLARAREAGETADWHHHHPRGEGCSH
jgi:hypothetical protein